MDKRLYAIVVAGLVIAGLCAYKAARKYPQQQFQTSPTTPRPAPAIELYDQSKPQKIVRLSAFAGRHQVIVAFFDGKEGAQRSATLAQLRSRFGELHARDIQVLAVSVALPQENRRAIESGGEFPFAILSDPDAHVHLAWGRWDEKFNRPTQGLFIVDRKGDVACDRTGGLPVPQTDTAATITRLAEGS